MPPSHIAVLGGGISGLTAAYYLAQRYPNTLISVLEKVRHALEFGVFV